MRDKLFITIFLVLLGCNDVFAQSTQTLAKCSALNNNFNHKYGAQLLDNGATYNTINEDKLYYKSSTYQMILMAKIAYLEKWNLSSYNNFIDEFDKSDFYSLVLDYDDISMQNLSVGKLQLQISQNACYDKFQKFVRSPGKEDKIMKIFDTIVPYLERARGF